MKPNNVISRQEVAALMSNIMRLEMAEDSAEMKKLKDYKDIQAWSKGAIGAVLNKGYMKGYKDYSFKSGNSITRAEAAVALKNIAGNIYNAAGSYGDTTITGNVSVSNDGVTLKNLNIKGDLYLTEGIGNGTVTLDNVIVTGKTLVCGGGMDSIIIKNSTLGVTLVEKKNGKVRLEASGKTKVGKMQLRSGGKLEEKNLSDAGFEDVEVKKEIKFDAIIQFDGDFNNVDILSGSKIEVTNGSIAKLKADEGAKDAEIRVLAGKIESIEIKAKVLVEVSGGTIAKVTMDKASTGTTLDVKEGGIITSLIAEAVIEVIGKGKIEVAEVKISGVKFEVEPVKVIAAVDVKIQIGPDPTTTPTTLAVTTPTPAKTSSDDGGGSSDGTTEKIDVSLEVVSALEDAVYATVYNEDEGGFVTGLTMGNFTIMLDGDPVSLYEVNVQNNEYEIIPEENLIAGIYELVFRKSGYNSASSEFNILDEGSDFIPGEGGTITYTPFEAEEGKIGGLYIEKNHDYYSIIFDGDPIYYHHVELSFIPAEEFGANGYTLEYSVDEGITWADYESENTISETDYNYLISNPTEAAMYRLVVVGGDYDGYTSNEVTAEIPTIYTWFTGYSLDESMSISGVMAPWVGRGLEASFTAEQQNYPDENITYTDNYMTYQWYRVNPVSYEMTAIEGATELEYTTTENDVGYYLMIKATGDDENISGFMQVMSTFGVKIQNKAYVSNASDTGFTLNLHKEIPSLEASELSLIDYYGEPVEISIVSQGSNAAIYNISAQLDLSKGPYTLSNDSEFWSIVSDGFEQHVFEGVEVPYSVDRYEINVPYLDGVAVDTSYEAAEGETVTIYITLDEGKQLGTLAVTDADEGDVEVEEVAAGEEYTFVMPAKDVTVTVELAELVEVSAISVSPTTMTLTAGGATGTIIATIEPEDATNQDVTWSSDDESVATVVNGVVTPVAAGTATIIATSDADGTKTATCVVTVEEPVGVDGAASTVDAASTPAQPVQNAEFTFAVTLVDDNDGSAVTGLQVADFSFAEVLSAGGAATGTLTIVSVVEDGVTGVYTVTAKYDAVESIDVTVTADGVEITSGDVTVDVK